MIAGLVGKGQTKVRRMTMAARRRRAVVIGVASTLALMIAVAGPAYAGATDQQQTASANNQLTVGTGNQYAQTITVGRSGLLDQVDLLASRISGVTPTSPPLMVQIRAMSAAGPSDLVLASENVTYGDLPLWPSFTVVPVQFATPAPVVAGAQYAIVVTGAPAGFPSIYNYDLGVSTINAYPGGEGWRRPSGGAWQVYGPTVSDWWFRTYVAPWAFTGFQAPVDNATSEIVNRAKAGSSIPIKFSLGGDQGLGVISTGYPKLEPTPCDASDVVDPVEETATGSNGLTHDPTTDTYTYVWKTQKRWAGTCGTLQVVLTDGSTHTAAFSFT